MFGSVWNGILTPEEVKTLLGDNQRKSPYDDRRWTGFGPAQEAWMRAKWPDSYAVLRDRTIAVGRG